jgi:phage protein D
MANTRPTFAITIADFSSTSDRAVGGPVEILVERDMDVAADGLELRLADRSGIALGAQVTVELGYDDDRSTVFTGEVAEVAPALPGAAAVRALGPMAKLLRTRKAATYESQSAGAIVRDLIDAAGADAGTVSDGPTLPRFAIDARVSAYAHVRGLANRLGYELYADHDGKIMFHGLGAAANLDAGAGLGALAGAASAVGALTGGGGDGYAFGKHLVAAAARHTVAGAGTVNVGGESPMSSKGDATSYWLSASETDPDGSAGDGDPTLLRIDPAARTTDLAARFAAGYLATRNRRANEVAIDVLGRASVELGDTISVGGVPGDADSLSGYVRAIRHAFDARRGFVSRLRVALEPAS